MSGNSNRNLQHVRAKHRLKGHAGRCYITITSSTDLLDVDLPLPGESSVRCRGERKVCSLNSSRHSRPIGSTTLSHPQGPTPKRCFFSSREPAGQVGFSMLWPNTSRTARRRTHRSISTSCVPWSWGFRAAQGLPDILIVRSSTAPGWYRGIPADDEGARVHICIWGNWCPMMRMMLGLWRH